MSQGARTIPKVDWNKAFEFTWRILVFIVATGIIIIVSTNWNRWEGGAGWQTTNDAYLQADLTPISAKVGGYLRELPIQDYERVHEGQVLAQLVDDDYRAAVAQAQASIESATAQSEALKAQQELQLATIEAARAVVAATTALVAQNDRDLARQERLLQTGSSSTEAREKLETTQAQLDAQLAQNRAQATAAERQLAVLARAARAESSARSPRRRQRSLVAKLNLSYTTITATQDGVIGQRQVKPGQLVGAGTQITTLDAVAERLGHRELQGDAAHAHGGRAKGGDHRRHLSGTHAARTCAGIRAGLGRRVCAAAARQRDRELHQGRAAHRGEDRDRRCGRPGRSARARHVGRGEGRRPRRQALMNADGACGRFRRNRADACDPRPPPFRGWDCSPCSWARSYRP